VENFGSEIWKAEKFSKKTGGKFLRLRKNEKENFVIFFIVLLTWINRLCTDRPDRTVGRDQVDPEVTMGEMGGTVTTGRQAETARFALPSLIHL
jgi:hypothetical protein